MLDSPPTEAQQRSWVYVVIGVLVIYCTIPVARALRDAIDAQLSRLATHWSLPRMAVTDRNVLRLGAFEILYGDTPGRVAVNEAIILAKRYGDKNSQRFVNGILDRLLKDVEEESADATAETADPSAAIADDQSQS